jgi:hypothetical protein
MHSDPRPWWASLFDPYRRRPVWRSVDKWPRRDSVLVVGLLAFPAYVGFGVVLFGGFGLPTDLVVGFMATLLGAAMLAEASFAVRPNKQRLRRADQLIAAVVGVSLVIGAISGLILLAGGLTG